jgi:hypothetical protein
MHNLGKCLGKDPTLNRSNFVTGREGKCLPQNPRAAPLESRLLIASKRMGYSFPMNRGLTEMPMSSDDVQMGGKGLGQRGDFTYYY